LYAVNSCCMQMERSKSIHGYRHTFYSHAMDGRSSGHREAAERKGLHAGDRRADWQVAGSVVVGIAARHARQLPGGKLGFRFAGGRGTATSVETAARKRPAIR